MAEPQDVDTLRRRGRRRLVGAIALVLLAVIVLPMVFDQQPKRTTTVNVRIPSEDEGALPQEAAPQPVPSSAAPAPSAAQPPTGSAQPAQPELPKPAPAPQSPAAPKPESKAENQATAKPSAAERQRAEEALEGKDFIVPVAALVEQKSVRALTARLRSAKLPYYTEAINTKHGKVTRVRVGPFVSREMAERARAKLVKLGLKPGPVAPQS